MKPISPSIHGRIDYLTAIILFLLPRVLGWNSRLTQFLTTAAVGTLGYSLVTRYDMGALKLLPFSTHLTLDKMTGALFCAAPLLLSDEKPEITKLLAGIGLFELTVTLTTNPHT